MFLVACKNMLANMHKYKSVSVLMFLCHRPEFPVLNTGGDFLHRRNSDFFNFHCYLNDNLLFPVFPVSDQQLSLTEGLGRQNLKKKRKR